ncbi:hypothetical protein [Kitasatospora aureofaciens]|uniref:hypothetical protein n=1 Tax=Kitasatospora aureofaciens TaxID=1894 RepID=UPI001D6F888B|nr:hypothetical protein [Kitasatospora aureofaciens]HJD83789.1 beta family protein [Kitasatospora aureofaciens]
MEYVPILRGKAGEFIALRNTSADVQAHIRRSSKSTPTSAWQMLCGPSPDTPASTFPQTSP